jgi:choline dehydrogenase-like flavoprotein
MRYHVAIVGSGAAGAVMAWRLACKGLKVVVLERGGREDPTTFVHSEFRMMPRVYKHGGLQTTSNNDMVILQGSTVGGSTVINNAIWKRADLDTLLPKWKKLGAPLDRAALEAGYRDLETVLNVSLIPITVANAATKPFLDGSAAAGIDAALLDNNRKLCLGCGWCNYGCRYNRKTSMLVTLIPWAEAKGAQVRDRCMNIKLDTDGRRVSRITYDRHGFPEQIVADRYVVCAGAIGSSEVLLNSGIKRHGRVGEGFHVLGGVTVTGELPRKIDTFDGIGLTAIANASNEYVIESFFSPPGAFSVTAPGFFEEHATRMKKYAFAMQAGTMVGCAPRGRVSLQGGRVKIDLALSKDEVALLKKGIKDIARVFFKAGANPVYPSTYKPISFANEADLARLDAHVQGPEDLLLGSAHPQGGNSINEDPAQGVVDLNFRVHDFENLFLADASVFPTNIQVNCQATVMAIAHTAADSVAR